MEEVDAGVETDVAGGVEEFPPDPFVALLSPTELEETAAAPPSPPVVAFTPLPTPLLDGSLLGPPLGVLSPPRGTKSLPLPLPPLPLPRPLFVDPSAPCPLRGGMTSPGPSPSMKPVGVDTRAGVMEATAGVVEVSALAAGVAAEAAGVGVEAGAAVVVGVAAAMAAMGAEGEGTEVASALNRVAFVGV